MRKPLPGAEGDAKRYPHDAAVTFREIGLFDDECPVQVVSMRSVTVDGIRYRRTEQDWSMVYRPMIALLAGYAADTYMDFSHADTDPEWRPFP